MPNLTHEQRAILNGQREALRRCKNYVHLRGYDAEVVNDIDSFIRREFPAPEPEWVERRVDSMSRWRFRVVNGTLCRQYCYHENPDAWRDDCESRTSAWVVAIADAIAEARANAQEGAP